MVDNRKPVEKDCYNDIMSKVETVKDYFDYKISYFVNDDKSGNFPERREKLIPLYMTEEQEQKYNKLKNEGPPYGNSEKPNSFYSAEKYASNMIDRGYNPKTQYVINEIKNKPNQKFIVYSGLYNTGIINIVKELEKNNIKFRMITGKQNTPQKEDSKFYFNFYNFKSDNFFDLTSIDQRLHKYINSEYRVLLITRAGAEGVDTINCQNIILLDGQWNDALSEQIIARAIRFKSHFGLPISERYVNVLRPLFCFEKNKKIIEGINNGKNDFKVIKQQMKEVFREEMKNYKGSDERYLPTLKELRELKVENHLFIPEKTNYHTSRGGWGRGSKTMQKGPDGWDKYNTLTTDEKRKEWRKHMYYEWLVASKKIVNEIPSEYTIDLYLYILSKAKQQTIDEFISFFGKGIDLYEKYESLFMKELLNIEKDKKRKLTEEEKINFYMKSKRSEMTEILKFDEKLMVSKKSARNTKNQLQQFYTNEILANYVYEYSSLKTNKNENVIILEPSTGEGDLIKPILKNNINAKISMVEIDPLNRRKLKILVDKTPSVLQLMEQPNFLLFQSSTRYDYIFMNPPFHLRKSEDYNLLKDVWDFDFIQRAFGFLKVGGELLAIVSKKFLQDKNFMDWTKNKNKKFEYDIRKNEKFSGIKIDIAVLKITKLTDDEDSELMSRNYYVKQDEKGKMILNNEMSLSVIKSQKDNNNVLKSYKQSEIEEINEIEELEALEKELEQIINQH